jgi:sulfonate transport system substrate-binding protein
MKFSPLLLFILISAAAAPEKSSQKPEPLASPIKLTIAAAKVAHLAPLLLVPEYLKPMNVDLEVAEFVRYADARTALVTGAVDLATIGPADLPLALSQGSDTLVALMGVGSSPKYVVARNGVEIKQWKDLCGKRVGIAPGSAVWFQFAATLQEVGVPYNCLVSVNIQGAGTSFDAALKRGDVDAIITWEPFESIPVIERYGYWVTHLDYSRSHAVGAELGMIAAHRSALAQKREAIRRFVWAYIRAQNDLSASRPRFAESVRKFTGISPEIARRVADSIELGAVLSLDQLKRQAALFYKLGVIRKDVTGQLDKYFDSQLVNSVLGN